ncbi:hypothetical protein [Halobaculum sp. EA56]|uniref:hypothetical protein n=1 Tax=Halobaculum sp. EA56 TaxID=3421648 RepID=UPI003EB8ED55
MSSEGSGANADGVDADGTPGGDTADRTRVVNTGDGYERVAGAADDGATDSRGDEPAADEGLGRAGWVLVGVVVLAFLVIPGAIYLRPTAPGELGFGFLAAMLVLPFLPALLLGVTAVWSLAVGRE